MLFISDAYAQDAAGAMPGGALGSLLPFVLMFVLLYFMMIRPQMKRQKEMKAMLAALKKGDEVATIGGVVGKITKTDDNFITLEVSRSNGNVVEMVFQRGAVQSILPTGSIK
ncbi:preprotein translocase subunit YajC [Formosimonas limnophila]|uniref:Sec translocon accessory complex subunit YajC n=1 Tax=Formosimonas limnophila TaxID=1384487 RepID=A0A8J3G076_9BURK|nr:preprotein translocase subunit YajC [Formosimonas limnophila]GHA66415.1 preprotein translocase subunit YajC [Formosimonas limnophila]